MIYYNGTMLLAHTVERYFDDDTLNVVRYIQTMDADQRLFYDFDCLEKSVVTYNNTVMIQKLEVLYYVCLTAKTDIILHINLTPDDYSFSDVQKVLMECFSRPNISLGYEYLNVLNEDQIHTIFSPDVLSLRTPEQIEDLIKGYLSFYTYEKPLSTTMHRYLSLSLPPEDVLQVEKTGMVMTALMKNHDIDEEELADLWALFINDFLSNTPNSTVVKFLSSKILYCLDAIFHRQDYPSFHAFANTMTPDGIRHLPEYRKPLHVSHTIEYLLDYQTEQTKDIIRFLLLNPSYALEMEDYAMGPPCGVDEIIGTNAYKKRCPSSIHTWTIDECASCCAYMKTLGDVIWHPSWNHFYALMVSRHGQKIAVDIVGEGQKICDALSCNIHENLTGVLQHPLTKLLYGLTDDAWEDFVNMGDAMHETGKTFRILYPKGTYLDAMHYILNEHVCASPEHEEILFF